jgi:hypothetical protein
MIDRGQSSCLLSPPDLKYLIYPKDEIMKTAARFTGLIIASLIAAIYLFIIIGGLFEGSQISMDFESLGIFVLSLFTIFSVITAWINVRIGVWLVLGVGILFSIFALVTAGSHHIMAVMAAGGPLIISALLILLGLTVKKK